jgi:signal transduction histidine kinase
VKGRASFRSQLLIGSVLWTLGVFAAISAGVIQFLGTNPAPHRFIYMTFNAHVVMALVLGGAVMAAGAWQIRRSLAAMGRLQTRLASVHRGEEQQVEGQYPAEVQPLVDDLNALLADREQRMRRALAKAGDLAHGLKTPLAVLARDARRAEASGHTELASSLVDQVERMRRQIDYHLAHARAAAASAGPGTRAMVAPAVDGLIRTLQRLHADRGMTFDVAIAPDDAVRCQREDLEEVLGNLLDNACKWGRSRVRIESIRAGTSLAITVDDDGPGLDPAMAARVLERGVRADEAIEGSGLGLAIVRDLADLYGGAIALSESPLGGLRACLRLPAAD